MPTIAIMNFLSTKLLISPLDPPVFQTPSTYELPFKDFPRTWNFTLHVLKIKAPKVPLNKQMSANSEYNGFWKACFTALCRAGVVCLSVDYVYIKDYKNKRVRENYSCKGWVCDSSTTKDTKQKCYIFIYCDFLLNVFPYVRNMTV